MSVYTRLIKTHNFIFIIAKKKHFVIIIVSQSKLRLKFQWHKLCKMSQIIGVPRGTIAVTQYEQSIYIHFTYTMI